MSTLAAIEPLVQTRRYEALLRAVNAVALCSDCDAAANALTNALREVIPFDYLHVVTFDRDTNAVQWSLLEAHGRRMHVFTVDGAALENTLMA